jgi:hypothetical protein
MTGDLDFQPEVLFEGNKNFRYITAAEIASCVVMGNSGRAVRASHIFFTDNVVAFARTCAS